jgi:hypothetical protein
MIKLATTNRFQNLAIALLGIAVLVAFMVPRQAFAAGELTNRKVVVSTSVPAIISAHTFSFTITTASSVGSMMFEYCVNSPFIGVPCIAPAGFDVQSAAISSQTGETGFSVDGVNTTANKLVITRAPAVTSPQPVQYVISNVTNPSTAAQTVFVRMATYASVDATGAITDNGTVVFSTSGQLSATAFVPPYLTFCVGVIVAVDCISTSGNLADFGEFKSTQTKSVTSQMSVATNDPGGDAVTLVGTSMTSGSTVIPASTIPTSSTIGAGQFGMNLRINPTLGVGMEPAGAGTTVPSANYGVQNKFTFNSGDVIASSPISTDFTLLTCTFIVNIPAGQAPGQYATTASFIASAAF